MLIRVLVGLSGPTITLSPGQEAYFPDDDAVRLIAAGYAVAVEPQKIERAVKSARKVEKR